MQRAKSKHQDADRFRRLVLSLGEALRDVGHVAEQLARQRCQLVLHLCACIHKQEHDRTHEPSNLTTPKPGDGRREQAERTQDRTPNSHGGSRTQYTHPDIRTRHKAGGRAWYSSPCSVMIFLCSTAPHAISTQMPESSQTVQQAQKVKQTQQSAETRPQQCSR